MIQIALCDDSSYMRKVTKERLLQYSVQKNIELQIQEYETGEQLLEVERSQEKQHDLIFIDYEFEEKGENGLEIIRKLRKFQKNTKVIFLSSYPQVVFQSFEVDAFRFLVKPLEEEKLFQAMDDFLDLLTEERILTVKIDGENGLIEEGSMTHIEGFGKSCILYFVNQRDAVVCNETISSVEERLSDCFIRCHKSFLVNMEHIDSYSRTGLTLDTGEKILIGRTRYKNFIEAFTEFISKKRGI
ncbi:MAG: LytR/AlgR family response regulator transcription factor [Lachnospiraceae bacterium]